MPNLFYLFIQFIHLMALTIWVGGIVMVGFFSAPVIFKHIESRKKAGEIVGDILNKFNYVVLICIVALVITSIVKYLNWENPTPWITIRYAAISIMSFSALYSTFFVSPKISILKNKIESFDSSSKNEPDRLHFTKLHRVSTRCMSVSLFFGVISILLA